MSEKSKNAAEKGEKVGGGKAMGEKVDMAEKAEMGEKVGGGEKVGPVEEDTESKVQGDARGVEEVEEEMRQEE